MTSAANRIALVAFAFYTGATLLLGVVTYFATHAAFSRQIDARIAQTSASLQAEFRDEGPSGVIDSLRARQAFEPDAVDFALFDSHGRRIGGKLETAMPAPGWQTISFIDPVEGPDPARALTTMLDGGDRLVVAEDLSPLEEIDRTILTIFGLTFAALILLGIGAAVLLATFLRRRLAQIGATADAIIAGDLGRRAEVGRHDDEFDRAASSLNAMLNRIAELIANLRQVTSDLAHDLRTPLSRLRNQLDTLCTSQDESLRRPLVERALAQADEVLSLFDAILRISEVEEGSLRKAFATVDISDLVTDLGETLAPLIEDSGRRLLVDVPPALRVHGDRELIAQALINLVENARRHTMVGATIRLIASRQSGVVLLSVCDDGPGIAEADRERAQQRFVRLEASRSTPGHGLGLSLVLAIARAHGASMILTDANPGLAVELRFAEAAEKVIPSERAQ
ncbi:signal transduction histidine kinase [Novosphingobium capsulatum]|uniref:histidine kinase n=1 Tax=Novosphingobium capsulatum TaxID=13688 RepID=A0ABU1MNU6_9SPHN|nr:HAMP domain-containing sensor histidine kinase [Novosphingobium capsulatum]MDR6511932.1 signal transduction histidine kinase [Novosphingobium capsulatum]